MVTVIWFSFFSLFLGSVSWSSDIGLFTDQMVSSAKPQGGSQFQAIRSNLLFETDQSVKSHTELNLNISNSGFSYFALPQAHIELNDSFTVGRKIKNWSLIDQQWGSGLVQPNFSFNPLRKSMQGLTGLFYSIKRGNFSVDLFGSPLFIPSQGASSSVEDGKFVRKSPWYNPPPSKMLFSGREIPVFYEIDMPKISDVVRQQTFIASATLKEGHFLIGSAIGQKPINQLALGFNGQFNISTDRIEAEIVPKVAHHAFFSADLAYQRQPLTALLSIFYDQPKNPEFDSSLTYQEFTSATLISPTVEVNSEDYDFGVSYFYRSGGDEDEFGKFSNSGGTVLPSRFDFSRAIRIYVKRGKGRVTGQLGLTNEVVSQSYHLDARVKYQINPTWNTVAGFDLISSVGEGSDLYSTYSNGDRFYAGAVYEF